jgi:hypothetical protein
MAVQLAFNDGFGNTHMNCYVILDVHLYQRLKACEITIHYFKDKASRDAVNDKGLPVFNPVASVSVGVREPDFTQYFNTDALNNNNVFKQAYNLLADKGILVGSIV